METLKRHELWAQTQDASVTIVFVLFRWCPETQLYCSKLPRNRWEAGGQLSHGPRALIEMLSPRRRSTKATEAPVSAQRWGTVNGHRLPLPLHTTPKPSWLLTFSLIKTIMSCLHTCMLSCVSFATPWTGTSCHFLLQGIFLTQGLNLGLLRLLHLQADSLPLSHLECRVWFSCYVVSKSLQPHGL